MTSLTELDLNQQLAQITAASRDTVSAAVLAVMDQAREELMRSGIATKALRIGEQAPDFTLPNAVGKPYHLADGLTHGPVVITFYRGNWCPYCNLQLRVYQNILPQIHALGASLVAISPQTPDHSQATLLKNFLQYEVLSDVGNLVGHAYRLVYPIGHELQRIYKGFGLDLAAFNADDSWEIPLPGTFVIDRDRIVRFAFVEADYQQRLEPAVLLQILTELTQRK